MKKISLPHAPESFPLTALIENGVWAVLSPHARAVLGVVWDFHRKYPNCTKPSRNTLAHKAGVSPPTVTKAVKELESYGILAVLRTPGPRKSNRYELSWTFEYTDEMKARATSQGTKSPYASKRKSEVILIPGHERRKRQSRTLPGSGSYRCPDGCLLKSAGEVLLHTYLVEWNIPHFSGVRYVDLGIPLTDARGKRNVRATVDFVVSPTMMIEVARLPDTDRGAVSYRDRLKKKAEAAKAKGWTFRCLKSGVAPTWENLYEPIRKSWAMATAEEARRWLRRMEGSGEQNEKSTRLANALIHDAEERKGGQRQPKAYDPDIERERQNLNGFGPPGIERIFHPLLLDADSDDAVGAWLSDLLGDV